jgi:hypothetical protein
MEALTMLGRRPVHDLNSPDYPYKAQRARFLKLKHDGLCVVCGGPKPGREDRNYCAACAEVHRACNLRIRCIALDCGICVQCRKQAARAGKTMCGKCSKQETAKKCAKMRAHTLATPCPKCGGSRADGVCGAGYCKRCSAKVETAVQRARRLRSEGLCQYCARPRGDDGTTCYCRPCADEHSRKTYAAYKRKHGLD